VCGDEGFEGRAGGVGLGVKGVQEGLGAGGGFAGGLCGAGGGGLRFPEGDLGGQVGGGGAERGGGLFGFFGGGVQFLDVFHLSVLLLI
jgi:hypothetical protein